MNVYCNELIVNNGSGNGSIVWIMVMKEENWWNDEEVLLYCMMMMSNVNDEWVLKECIVEQWVYWCIVYRRRNVCTLCGVCDDEEGRKYV